ncbi:hypothetical protein QBC43DRAFT_7143 [Cladorrhinum sp. PSN259]|nr:hypothetical protein QBC43DRAFT_7143 [Cladorrhinum sp. PSN259]
MAGWLDGWMAGCNHAVAAVRFVTCGGASRSRLDFLVPRLSMQPLGHACDGVSCFSNLLFFFCALPPLHSVSVSRKLTATAYEPAANVGLSAVCVRSKCECDGAEDLRLLRVNPGTNPTRQLGRDNKGATVQKYESLFFFFPFHYEHKHGVQENKIASYSASCVQVKAIHRLRRLQSGGWSPERRSTFNIPQQRRPLRLVSGG